MHALILILLAITDVGLGFVDLFRAAEDAKKFVPCHRRIVKHFDSLNGTGTQVYKTKETHLHRCPNVCEQRNIIKKFCKEHSTDFIEDFGGKSDSDRCCDERSCKCICHFRCSTFDTRMEEYKAVGFNDCLWKSDKMAAINGIKDLCKEKEAEKNCGQLDDHIFICPKQFSCVDKKCLICAKPNCVSSDDLDLTKQIINEFNTTKSEPMDSEPKENKKNMGPYRTMNMLSGKTSDHSDGFESGFTL